MNIPITFSEQGAHFRISTSELASLDVLSYREYDAELRALPIGKAALMLRLVVLAGGDDALVEKDGREVVRSDMDGADATTSAMAHILDPLIGDAVMNVGRLTVDVIESNEIDNTEAKPVTSFEVLSGAYKWAQNIVQSHKDQLIDNPEITPVVPFETIDDMPERGDTALERQGLWLTPSFVSFNHFAIHRTSNYKQVNG